MIPLIAQIGPLPIHSFGLMLMCGILAGWYRLALSLRQHNFPVALAERSVFWGAVAGIAGARLFFILSHMDLFLQDPIGVAFGQAGFVFYGSLVCGALAVWVVIKLEGLSFLRIADLYAVPLAIGYGVGRIGCQLSGDGDYGIPSALPWAMSYAYGVYPTEPGVLVHPTPVYETIAALTIAIILYWCERNQHFSRLGSLFGFYLLLMGLERYVVEIIRIEPRVLWGFSQAQLIGIVCAFVGSILVLRGGGRAVPSETDLSV